MDEKDKVKIETIIEDLTNLEFKYSGELDIPERCASAKYELEQLV